MATAFENEDSSIVEFQLGNKQLFLLFLGLLVICAIFFFIGLRVGEDTAKAKVPVDIGGAGPADTANGTVTEQTLDLQPLSKQKQTTKEETRPVEQSAVQQQQPEVQNNKPVTNNEARNSEKPITKEKATESSTEQKPTETKATSPATTGIFVQVLSSTDLNKAQRTKAAVGGNVATQIQNAIVKGKTYYRVLIGPFKTQDAASAYRQQILPKFKDAFLQIIR